MEAEDHMCSKCTQPISNPICERCHVREISSWMRDRDFPQLLQEIILETVEEKLLSEPVNLGYCVICQNEVPNICSYCFFLRAAKLLKTLGLNQKDLNSFLETFNYRQYQEDYII